MATTCSHDPQNRIDMPVGSYPCPECGVTVTIGQPHPAAEEAPEEAKPASKK